MTGILTVVVAAGDPIRELPAEAALAIVSSRAAAAAPAAAGRSVCLALPSALPLAPSSIDRIAIRRGAVAAVGLPAVLGAAAAALRPGGTIDLAVSLRAGPAGMLRRLASAILPVGPAHRPRDVCRDLVLAGFDRVEQDLRGSIGRYVARRLPG